MRNLSNDIRRHVRDSIGTDILIYMEVLTFVNRFTALRFTETGPPPAARRVRILLMNQYAGWSITFGIKGSD
jgi:hypothetical protein